MYGTYFPAESVSCEKLPCIHCTRLYVWFQPTLLLHLEVIDVTKSIGSGYVGLFNDWTRFDQVCTQASVHY